MDDSQKLKQSPEPRRATRPGRTFLGNWYCTAEEKKCALRKAAEIRDARLPSLLAHMLCGEAEAAKGMMLYLDAIIKDAGDPIDPVERMILEQITLAHQRIITLHAEAHTEKTLEAVKILNNAAVRLQGEFRRLALALRLYRAPTGSKSFSVVHQQNVVSGGDQQVSYLDQSQAAERRVSLAARDQPKSNGDQEGSHGRIFERGEESEPSSGRPNQRREAETLDRRAKAAP